MVPSSEQNSEHAVSLKEDYWLDPVFNVKTAVFNLEKGSTVDISNLKESLDGVISVDQGKDRIIVNYCPDTTLAKKILGDIQRFFFN